MTRKNPLQDLHRFGVSVWYDNVSRGLIASGELKRLIDEDGVRGLTSNPTIFEKAIGGSADYDGTIRRHARPGLPPAELFELLAVEDIQAACDVFRPLYDASKGGDGFVSLEVAPALAKHAGRTVAEAKRLWTLVARPNLMVKVPGTEEGVLAFEELTAEGISINVTLLFAQERYTEVAEAYVKGLERRAAAGKDLSRIASVASFFVSRVDTAIDALLEKRPEPEAKGLLGKAAIANAKLAYQHYKKLFGSPRFAALAAKGAKTQRLLWASTGTKNPLYRDVLYVEELIGLDTVNTMPPATVDAYRAHGAGRFSLEENVDEARAQWEALPRHGVDLSAVMAKLTEDGLKSFAGSFETLMGKLAAKRALLETENAPADAGLAELESKRFAERLWAKDASVWKDDAAHQKLIKHSLGWLTAPESTSLNLGPVRALADEAARDGIRHVVILGMGGSSLCVETIGRCLPLAAGRPRLHVLDSTHPDKVRAVESELDLEKTLFVLASKSGSTIEPNCLFEYFWSKIAPKAGAKAGRSFVAITDPGTSLEKLARERGFRKTFLNPSDVGGRFSALTMFGIVPAALAGADAGALLDRARAAAKSCSPQTPTRDNPGLRLGSALGRHAREGRDKLTLVLDPRLETLGLWIEQLIAESTGKEGKGIFPVVGETLGAPSDYGRDRLFVRVGLKGRDDRAVDAKLAALEQAGHPVVRLELADELDLGAQFFLWEVATAAAGFLLGVDPFDQPDVQSAKTQTVALLDGLTGGALPAEKPDFRAGGLAAFADAGLKSALKTDGGQDRPLREVLDAHLARVAPGDYVCILAYLAENDESRRILDDVRRLARARSTAPVTVSWGPRYLHSTGQLYKGGSGRGVFLFLSDAGKIPLPVPGRSFTFSTLCRAQARGDAAATLASGRRLLRLELGASTEEALRALANALSADKAAAR
ncbi:MAG: bifunctional transaldolase/phosoglucose isomerase [Elusimicrobiota bacterium]